MRRRLTVDPTDRVTAPLPVVHIDLPTSTSHVVRLPSATSASSDGRRRDATDAGETGAPWALRYRRRLRLADTGVVAASVVAAAVVASVRTAVVTDRLTVDQVVAGVADVVWVPVLVGLVWAASLSFYRTRELAVVGTGAAEYRRVGNATLLAFTVAAIWLALLDGGVGGRMYFLVALPLGGGALVVVRWSMRRWLQAQRRTGRFLSRAVVVGSREDIRYVVDRVDRTHGAIYDIVGAATLDPESGGVLVGDRVVPIVAGVEDVPRAVWKLNVNSVIVAGDLGLGHEWLRDLGWQLEGRAAELVLASRLTNIAGPRITFRPVQGLPLMHVDIPSFDGPRHVLKRLFDVALAGTALLVLSPLLGVLAALVALDSSGPVLFRQRRVGRDGRTFDMVKFRSMVVDAELLLHDLSARDEGAGVLFKMRDDPRVTKVGRVLRRWSLDELPQLWNIVRGDMSIVGPRPPLPREVADYETHVHRRLYIKPGLTGMWQVNGRSDLSWEESVRLDLYYVENWSMAVDLVIIWRTFRVLVRHEGAY
jgi:exopolysaccharide biosynthesis polyprenyl glycosylphosphotransferase